VDLWRFNRTEKRIRAIPLSGGRKGAVRETVLTGPEGTAANLVLSEGKAIRAFLGKGKEHNSIP